MSQLKGSNMRLGPWELLWALHAIPSVHGRQAQFRRRKQQSEEPQASGRHQQMAAGPEQHTDPHISEHGGPLSHTHGCWGKASPLSHTLLKTHCQVGRQGWI